MTMTDTDKGLALHTAQSIETYAAALSLLRDWEGHTVTDAIGDEDDNTAQQLADARRTLELEALRGTCPDCGSSDIKNTSDGFYRCQSSDCRFCGDTLDYSAVEILSQEDSDAIDEARYSAALEMYAVGHHRQGDMGRNIWAPQHVVAVLTTGGPHVEVRWTPDSATVESWGWFGADRESVPVDTDAVNAYCAIEGYWEAID